MAGETAAAPAAPAGATPAAGAQQPGQAAPGTKPGETPAQAQARMLKRVVGDKEVELPESEVWTNYEKGKNAAQLLSKSQRVKEEALKAKMEAEGVLSRLKDKSNLRNVLQDLGYTTEDLRAMSQREILDAIEEEKLSPAERRAKDLERQLAERDKEKAAQEEEKRQAAHEEEKERHKDAFSDLFLKTFEGLGLPKQSARFVGYRMAHLYQQNEAAGLESTPEEMGEYIMDGLRNEHRGVLSGLKGDSLLEHLGPDVVKEVLSVHLARARAKRGVGAQPTPAPKQVVPKPAEGLNPRKGRFAAIEEMLKDA